ncbi:MAG: glutamate-1-semialdehyde 2,1-aminomutase [Planctomycetota bacterium]|nr:glutamate-1-semialdehyde 2,1-aminomutase [Planctomycetota bacterium]
MTGEPANRHDLPASREAYREACRHIPGGVNSPVRAFGAVGGHPVFIEKGIGAWVTDLDGRKYIDYVASYGPLILGHAHPTVEAAVMAAATRGLSFGAPTIGETDLARRVTSAFRSIEKVRFVNSGTEAALSAIRLARGVTGRQGLVKFAGCYHGHVDALLSAAGSGAAGLDSDSVRGESSSTSVLPFNNPEAVRETFRNRGGEIAALIVEPIPCNMGVVPPREGFLELLREVTEEAGALLIFDEVITGFRVGPAGAQGLFDIDPDITLLGKVIGGGMPVGAYGGRAEILDRLAPQGDVYQAGTLSGNPVAMAAGKATLDEVSADGFFDRLEETASALADRLASVFQEAGWPAVIHRVGSLIGLFFTQGEVKDFEEARAASGDRYAEFFNQMLERGVYLAPSPMEAIFISSAHGQEEIEKTTEAARESCAAASSDS